MDKPTHWAFPDSLQPRQAELRFNLQAALDAMVLLRAEIPGDAFTAGILGTERIGNGIVIREDGLVLTIGYLITEAESIWITASDGAVAPGHPLAYDAVTGFGLVLPLGRLRTPVLERGTSAGVQPGDGVTVIGEGGRAHALKAEIAARREFAGYWEYVLDEALFTAPAHPQWAGAALLNDEGSLIGVGSLLVQEARKEGETLQGNMFVPIDLLEPILEDMLKLGQPRGTPRPWIGVYVTQVQGHMLVNGVADGGPAARAGVREGDVLLEVAGERVSGAADLFRKIWRLGAAGVEVPLTISRKGAPVHARAHSADRNDLLKKPKLH